MSWTPKAMDVSEIEAEHPLFASVFRDAVWQNAPLVVRGVGEHWPAVKLWDVAYLAREYSSIPIVFRGSRGDMYPNLSNDSEVWSRRISLGEIEAAIIECQRGDERIFAGGDIGAENLIPSGARDLVRMFESVPLPTFINEAEVVLTGLWISSLGVQSWLHYDENGCHNFNVQIKGAKRLRLLAPTEDVVNTMMTAHHVSNFSMLDIRSLDNSFTSSPEGAVLVVELGPSDGVYIPPFWLHSFLHKSDENINFNFWWKNEHVRFSPVAIRASFIQALKGLGFAKAGLLTSEELVRRLSSSLADANKNSETGELVTNRHLRPFLSRSNIGSR